MKYYIDARASAKAQSVSIFQRYKEYQGKGVSDSLEKFLSDRGYSEADTILSDPIYAGQIRIIPRDQLEDAVAWLERMIKTEAGRRPEQVHRYEETLALLSDRLKNNNGIESIPLSREEAEQLATLAKRGGITADELGLTTETLMKYEYVLQQAFKAGLTAATITLVLKVAPEVYKAISYLIENGEIDKEQFKRIGFAAVTGSTEGFVRGSVSAALTTCFKAGLMGEFLKSVDPTIIGAVTVLTMNVLKNAGEVALGRKTRNELTGELVKDMYISACSLIVGGIGQAMIEVPVVGYMLGSFLGSLIGTFTYNADYKAALSFCVDSGFTMFGLVEQNYELPKELLNEIGVDVFDYETFEFDTFEADTFNIETFDFDSFAPDTLGITFLRRGVIGVNKVGYMLA